MPSEKEIRPCHKHGDSIHIYRSHGKNRPRKWRCQQCEYEYRRVWVNAKRDELKRRCIEYLGGRCLGCGAVYECVGLFHFHHAEAHTKTDIISDLIRKTHKWEVIEAELIKCRLLCTLCHAKLHLCNSCRRDAETSGSV